MINRAREIAQMMGYNSIDDTLNAIGRGELILLKINDEQRLKIARWIMDRVATVRGEGLRGWRNLANRLALYCAA